MSEAMDEVERLDAIEVVFAEHFAIQGYAKMVSEENWNNSGQRGLRGKLVM